MIDGGGSTQCPPLPTPEFDSHDVLKLPTVFCEAEGEVGALQSEEKVSFGVKMPKIGNFHHYINCF